MRIGIFPVTVLVAAALAVCAGLHTALEGLPTLPLVVAAALLPTRALVAVAGAYVAVRMGVDVVGSGGLVLGTLVRTGAELSIVALVAGGTRRLRGRAQIDALRAEIACAAGPDDLARALEARLLHGDVVAVALACVQGLPPVLAEILADVGRGAGPVRSTFRVGPQESFARAFLEGPLAYAPDPDGVCEGARIAAARGYGSSAVLPLRGSSGTPLGHLVLASSRSGAFTRRRLARLARQTAPLAGALEAFLIRRERDMRLRAATAGRQLSAELAGARSREEVLRPAVERTRELIGASDVLVLQPTEADAEVLELVASVGSGPAIGRIDTRTEPSGMAVAMSRGEPVWLPDAPRSPLANPHAIRALHSEALLFVPFMAGGSRVRGGLVCAWRRPRILHQEEIELVVCVALEVAGVLRRLEAERRLREQATHDQLTGLLNRGAFHDAVVQALASRDPVALVLADLDHLKHANDAYGHRIGDAAIRQASDALRRAARAGDALGRIGGDEFGWLLSGSDATVALAAGERAVRLVAEEEVPSIGSLSLSAGVAAALPGDDLESLFERADQALYAAKSRGRGVAVAAGSGVVAAADGEGQWQGRVGAATTLEGAAAAIADEWARAYRATSCCLSVLDGDGRRLRTVGRSSTWEASQGGRYDCCGLHELPGTVAALRARRPYTCRLDDADAEVLERATLADLGASSLLLVPIVGARGVTGTIEVFDARPRVFSSDEQRLALVMSGYVGVLLDRFLGDEAGLLAA